MDVLLDTQAVIWSLTNPAILSEKARFAIREADHVYVSTINFYEIAIKIAIGKDPDPERPVIDFINEALLVGFTWLPLSAIYIEVYTQLPFYEQHKDPFDRMILAIALADNLTVVSSDRNFPLYRDTINVLW